VAAVASQKSYLSKSSSHSKFYLSRSRN